MGTTPRYGFTYLDRLEPLVNTRPKLQQNAETAEAAVAKIAGYVDQLVSVLPGGATYVGLDTDGVPFYDPTGAATQPAGVGIDTDGVPYIVAFTDRSTL